MPSVSRQSRDRGSNSRKRNWSTRGCGRNITLWSGKQVLCAWTCQSRPGVEGRTAPSAFLRQQERSLQERLETSRPERSDGHVIPCPPGPSGLRRQSSRTVANGFARPQERISVRLSWRIWGDELFRPTARDRRCPRPAAIGGQRRPSLHRAGAGFPNEVTLTPQVPPAPSPIGVPGWWPCSGGLAFSCRAGTARDIMDAAGGNAGFRAGVARRS